MDTRGNRRTPAQASIEQHGAESGPPTRAAVEQRATELAALDGRARDEVTEEDRAQARRELRGETLPLSTDESRSTVLASRDPANLAVDTGRAAPTAKPPDERQLMEQEIQEGLREADHERRLAARRQQAEADAAEDSP